VEEIFGWMKTIGGMRKLRHRGLELVGWMFTFTAAAYNLIRIRNLTKSVAGAPFSGTLLSRTRPELTDRR